MLNTRVQPSALTTPTAVLFKKRAYLIGLAWETLPRDTKDVRRFAAMRKADKYIACQYSEPDSESATHTMVALLNLSALTLPKSVSSHWSLALLIKPLIENGGYAVFELESARFGFVSCLNGVLISDLVGTQAEIREAVRLFTTLNPPKEGETWPCYAPADWKIDGSLPLALEMLTHVKRPAETARLKTVSRKKMVIGMGVSGVLLLAGLQVLGLYQDYLTAQAIEAAKQARQARDHAEKAAVKITPPWHSQPLLSTFVQRCTQARGAIPISIAGWRFAASDCESEGEQGTLRASYKPITGVTVQDFTVRLNELFHGQVSPYFFLPEGNAGGFTLPLTFTAPDTPLQPEQLPSRSALQERLTTFAQRMRLSLRWDQVNNQLIDEQGNKVPLPWEEYNVSLSTAIPPIELFNGFSEPAVRFLSMHMTLEGGRLSYEVKGKFYVKHD